MLAIIRSRTTAPEMTVNFAIIDATRASGPPLEGSGCSRYATQIANLPLIGHVLDELAAAGIREAQVIARPEVRRDLARLLGAGRSWGLEVTYLDAPGGSDGREAVLAEIDQALATGPVLLHPGDCLFRAQVVAMRERFDAGDVDTVLPVQASVDASLSPMDRQVSKTILVLGPETRGLIEDLRAPKSEGDDLLAVLLHSDVRLAVCEQSEHWCYDESTEALLAANRMLLDSLPAPPPETSFSDENQVHGRVTIDPGAWVSNCVLYGPISIDDRAVLEDSYVGPYTAIGAGAVLSGAEVDNAMILAGAEIRNPGHRIEASIVGERARVTRSFELPKGLHVRLGPDSSVRFS
jgi:glucose-1-phosphate thymidylyltransferase